MIDKRYKPAFETLQRQERILRNLIEKIEQGSKSGRHYHLSKSDVRSINDVWQAWFDFLRTARR